MKKLLTVLAVFVVLAIAFLAFGPLYVVDEGEQAVVTRFGEIVRVETEAGLKFRTPFIDNVVRFPRRIQSWDGEPNRVPTSENQFIFVDTSARWRISDPALFYASTTSLPQAVSRLDDLLDSAVRTVITDNTLEEAVRSTNLILDLADESEVILEAEQAIVGTDVAEEDSAAELAELRDFIQAEVPQNEIRMGRRMLAEAMYNSVVEDIRDFGIELIDVVIRQIRYSDELTESVYDRMVSERNQFAQFYRSFGEGRKQRILGQIEQERDTILSEAQARAEAIRGDGDAQAARIYTRAYAQSTDGFYEFWLTMESYRNTMPAFSATLSTDMEYFRFLERATQP
ncbi:MAG: protease modulator HflC [Spirochaetaceae bacterium]|nr:MAG: protease modulator HflC [Spirochaetaceae bacterium]